jgi:hypothetical protein
MRRRIFKSLPVLMFAAAAMTPLGSHAAEVRPLIKAGFNFGGDTVVSVGVTGGVDSSTKSIKANEGVFVGLGASVLMDSKTVEMEVSASYKFATIAAQDGDIDWTVVPLDALVFYRLPYVRLGGGLTYHLGPRLKGSGAASDLNAKYDDALGFVLQADYALGNQFNFGLRYTSVNYKAKSTLPSATLGVTPAANAKTSGIGIVFSMSF